MHMVNLDLAETTFPERLDHWTDPKDTQLGFPATGHCLLDITQNTVTTVY